MAVLPDGLGPIIEVAIRHAPGGVLERDWFTTYAFEMNEDFATTDVTALVLGLIAAEKDFYFSNVTFHGGYGRRWVAKTIEPNPDPWVYNPTNHVPVAWLDSGGRSLIGEEVLYIDAIWDLVRVGDYGNPGRIEIRGGLSNEDVNSTLVSRSFADASTFADRVADFETAFNTLVAGIGCIGVLIGQPRLSIERFIVDNVLRTIKEYGAQYVRQVESFALGVLRTDKGKARWHNNPA